MAPIVFSLTGAVGDGGGIAYRLWSMEDAVALISQAGAIYVETRATRDIWIAGALFLLGVQVMDVPTEEWFDRRPKAFAVLWSLLQHISSIAWLSFAGFSAYIGYKIGLWAALVLLLAFAPGRILSKSISDALSKYGPKLRQAIGISCILVGPVATILGVFWLAASFQLFGF